MNDKLVISGGKHLLSAIQTGRGVLLLCPHYSMLDLVAPLVHTITGRFVISYRPNDNLLFNQAVYRSRKRYAELVDVRALCEIVKHLKRSQMVWFEPDQDMGSKDRSLLPSLVARHTR